MKMLKMAERYAARVCYLCAAIGALVVIKGAISAEPGMAAYGAFLTLVGFSGRALLFTMDIYDHLRDADGTIEIRQGWHTVRLSHSDYLLLQQLKGWQQ